MASSLTLENRLILACARTDSDVDEIQKLAGHGPDWQTIVRRSEHWGVAPLLYTSLRQLGMLEQVPASVIEHLKHLFRRETIHSVGQREMIRICLMRFVEAGIPVVVLHELALATLVYPSPNLRPIIDIDLLVNPHHHEQVESILASVQRDYPDIPYLGQWGIHQINLHQQLPPVRNSVSGQDTDILFPSEDLWQRAQAVQIESVTTLVLSYEDLLLHLVSQLWALEGVDSHIQTLCDIGELCRRYGDAIDWDSLVRHTEDYGVTKQLSYSLHVARDLQGVDVPIPVLESLQANFDQRSFEERFVAAVERDTLLADSQPDKYTKYALAYSAVNAAPSADPPQHAEVHTPTQQAQPTVNRHGRGELAVTYDQYGASDGVGSQLQRIYGLYALSRALNIKYIHTPLVEVRYQGFIALLTQRPDPNFVERYNAFFSLPSDDFDLEGCERIKIHNLDLATVECYRAQAAATGRSILLQTLIPFAYTDTYPAAYQNLYEVSPYRDYKPSGPIRVCIHMRRGDNLPDSRKRWLPNSYYLRVCQQIIEGLQHQGAAYTLQLHSELPTRRYALYPLSTGLYFEPEQPVTIDPADYALEDFDVLPNLEMVFNAEPLDAFRDFATADVLILSASSFGYLGGMLNPHGVVVFAPLTWNKPMPHWLVADQEGNLNPDEVTAKLIGMLQGRRG